MNSPLQLLARKFTIIELHSHLGGEPIGEPQISHFHSIESDDDEPNHWNATFVVRLENKSEEEPAPYVGEIAVVGRFELAEGFPEDKAEQMVYLNSGAILYGAIRELVLTLTSQSIHEEFNLPTVDARSFIPSEEAKESS